MHSRPCSGVVPWVASGFLAIQLFSRMIHSYQPNRKTRSTQCSRHFFIHWESWVRKFANMIRHSRRYLYVSEDVNLELAWKFTLPHWPRVTGLVVMVVVMVVIYDEWLQLEPLHQNNASVSVTVRRTAGFGSWFILDARTHTYTNNNNMSLSLMTKHNTRIFWDNPPFKATKEHLGVSWNAKIEM